MGEIGEEFCPDCGVKVSPHHEAVPDIHDRELRAKTVFLAPDEIAGLAVQKILESEGVEAWLQSLQVPGHEGLLRLIDGYWGQVQVYEDQENRACLVIEEYLRTSATGFH
jgi:hypothetical protein